VNGRQRSGGIKAKFCEASFQVSGLVLGSKVNPVSCLTPNGETRHTFLDVVEIIDREKKLPQTRSNKPMLLKQIGPHRCR
jgi:hypothetical protein